MLIATALVVTGLLGGQACLSGNDLGQQPAPDFELTDNRGQPVRLRDFRGKAVVLTFIYTSCPDICPTSTNWERAYEYEVPWDTFLAVWEAQGFDGVAVDPPNRRQPEATAPKIEPAQVTGSTDHSG